MFESWFDAKEMEEDETGVSERLLAQEQTNSVVNMLHQILLPFLRRRVKSDVDIEIPPKKVGVIFKEFGKYRRLFQFLTHSVGCEHAETIECWIIKFKLGSTVSYHFSHVIKCLRIYKIYLQI